MFELMLGASLVLGILVFSLLLYFRKKTDNNNNVLLAMAIFCCCYSLFINNLNETRLIINYPFLIRTGNITGYLIFSFLYLYTRNTFYPGKLFRKFDWLYITPALLYVIDLFPFLISSNENKIAIMKENLEHPGKMFQVAEGWIAIKGFHFVFRYIWSLFIIVLQCKMIYKNRYFLRSSLPNNRRLFFFIITITLLHLPLLVPGIFGVLFQLKWYSLTFLNFNLSIVVFAIVVFLLFSPHITYGFYPLPIGIIKKEAAEINEEKHSAKDSYPKLFIDEKELSLLQEKMNDRMNHDKPFLNPRYSIHDFSRDTGIPVYQLSPILNNHYNINFSNWINKYRVAHFEQLCHQLDKGDRTIDALAKESGFSNRTTLTIAFKKEKNITPGLYLKKFRVNHSLSSFL